MTLGVQVRAGEVGRSPTGFSVSRDCVMLRLGADVSMATEKVVVI